MAGEAALEAFFREWLGRGDLEPAVRRETAARLSGLLARLRALDEARLQGIAPALRFDPNHAHYHGPPGAGGHPGGGEPVWKPLAGGGTGYGGTVDGTAGDAGTAPAGPAPEGHGPGAPAAPAAGRPAAPEPWPDATALAEAVRRGDASPAELVREALERIQRRQPALNAFVTVVSERALGEARAAEEALRRGEPVGPLCGVPVAIKDVIETAGIRTTAGSRLLADHVPRRDATVVRRLREAGAIVVGKTATHEFAFGPTTDSPHFGSTRNPWRAGHSPGGSSGGSGAAVAAGLVPLALGTDTGGSIRIPAAACGVVGLKPTYGSVSRAGVIPLSWSLDHVGPLCRTVRDAALALGVLAGPDPEDPTVPDAAWVGGSPENGAPAGVPPRTGSRRQSGAPLEGVRVGVAEGWLAEPIEPEVADGFRAALRVLERLGAALEAVDLPPASVMTLVNRLITLGEAGAYHAPNLARRAAEYSPDVRLRLELAQCLTARDYLTGQRLRAQLCREVSAAWAGVGAGGPPPPPPPPPSRRRPSAGRSGPIPTGRGSRCPKR